MTAKHMGTHVFMVKPVGSERLTPGVQLRVELEQTVARRPGPHFVGRAEVLEDHRLAVWLTGNSDAGRDARGLLEIDAVDVVLWGPGPTVRLRP